MTDCDARSTIPAQVELFEYLRGELRERGWSMTDLARRSGVSKQAVAQWLSEDRFTRVTPKPAACQKIAEALGVDADYVLELARHRKPRAGRTPLDAKMDAAHRQVDEWIAAVGEPYLPLLFKSWQAEAQKIIDIRDHLGSADNATEVAADKPAAKRGRKAVKGDSDGAGGPLTHHYPSRSPVLALHPERELALTG